MAEAAVPEFSKVDLAFSLGQGVKCYRLASAPWLRSTLKPVVRRKGFQVQVTGVYLGIGMPMSK